jgi:hypothetical protein
VLAYVCSSSAEKKGNQTVKTSTKIARKNQRSLLELWKISSQNSRENTLHVPMANLL